jgi:hypothetical protein
MIIQIYIIKFWIQQGLCVMTPQEELNMKWWHVFDTCLNSKKMIKKILPI